MSVFCLAIENIQNISDLRLEVDLSLFQLICIAGRNGVGKTTLIRALRNLSNADTFKKTASPNIFNKDSKITYRLQDDEVVFEYDHRIRSINCTKSIPECFRDLIFADLPIPYGARFNYFKSAGDADNDIRQALLIENYTKPDELIEFLNSIYYENKFDNLVEIGVKSKSYYCLKLDGDWYIREDYMSSGEYFLINLYRTIKNGSRILVIDEIDISLDAAAQVKLSNWLRHFCDKYRRSIIFTTHSLAIIKTLKSNELVYMHAEQGKVFYHPASYSYVKSVLFGFKGWDRYILTEDVVLRNFIEYCIYHLCGDKFYNHKTIYIGGSSQVVDLLDRNASEEFLADADNVIAILDGDQRQNYNRPGLVLFAPFQNVEAALYAHRNDADFPFAFEQNRNYTSCKDFYNQLQERRIATESLIFEYLCQKYQNEIQGLITDLNRFLR